MLEIGLYGGYCTNKLIFTFPTFRMKLGPHALSWIQQSQPTQNILITTSQKDNIYFPSTVVNLLLSTSHESPSSEVKYEANI